MFGGHVCPQCGSRNHEEAYCQASPEEHAARKREVMVSWAYYHAFYQGYYRTLKELTYFDFLDALNSYLFLADVRELTRGEG